MCTNDHFDQAGTRWIRQADANGDAADVSSRVDQVTSDTRLINPGTYTGVLALHPSLDSSPEIDCEGPIYQLRSYGI